MPVRPPAQPYWMGILQQSAQTTEAAFDRIDRNLERARQARLESEKLKIDTLTQMERFERDDRDHKLRERELNFRIEEAGRDNYFKQITHDLYKRRQSLDEIKARTDLIVNQYLDPLDKEIKALEVLPGTEKKVEELKQRRQSAVSPLLREMESLSGVASVEDPVEQDRILSDSVTRSLGIVDKALIGENDIDASLFPDSLVGEINTQYISENGEDSAVRDLTERNEIQEFISGVQAADPVKPKKGEKIGAKGFDFGPDQRPSEDQPNPKSYPVSGKEEGKPSVKNDGLDFYFDDAASLWRPKAELTNGSTAFSGQQYGPRVTQELIDSELAYIEGLRDKAIANGSYTTSLEKRYISHLDERLGKQNNPIRKGAASSLRTAIIADNIDADTRGKILLKAETILGPSEAARIQEEALIEKATLGEKEALAKLQREREAGLSEYIVKKEIDRQFEEGGGEQSSVERQIDESLKKIERIKSLLSDPDANSNNLTDAAIESLRKAEAAESEKLAGLLTQYQQPSSQDITVKTQQAAAAIDPANNKGAAVAQSILQGAGKSPVVDPVKLDASMGGDPEQVIKRTARNIALPFLGLNQDEFSPYIEKRAKGAKDANPYQISKAVSSGMRDRFAEMWDEMPANKKKAFSSNPQVKDQLMPRPSLQPLDIPIYSFNSGLSPKDVFIQMKMKDYDVKINEFRTQLESSMKVREEESLKAILRGE